MGKLVRNGIGYSDPVVDDRLNENSKNPVQNKVVTEKLAEKVGFSDVDSALSETSENPVQNKVLAAILNHFTFSANSKHYYLQPEQPSNPQDGDIWIG